MSGRPAVPEPDAGPDAPVGAALTRTLWHELGGDPATAEKVHLTGPPRPLASVFDVSSLAAASVAVANLAAADLLALRCGREVPAVHVDRRAAAAAFRSESLLEPVGWEPPPLWDAVAGVYAASDGWIRLHTNYASHRVAALTVLGVDADREAVRAAVAGWSAVELETAVVEAGGCAAALRDRATWLAGDAGRATAGAPLVSRAGGAGGAAGAGDLGLGPSDLPYRGVRVLDLTRVIAGPVCTRTLAALGADVVRVDPPGFDEVGGLLADTTVGKRCVALDLRDEADRTVFEHLVADAHVVVSGLRPGALAALGYAPGDLRRLNPSLVTAALDAWGWSGPWRGRRGFDSLVQMSCGIAAAGAAATGASGPVPLPAQALDHGTGYLLAGAVGRSLVDLLRTGRPTDVRASLLATADLLMAHPVPDGLDAPGVTWDERDTVAVDTAWGPARRCPHPGGIDGVRPRWVHPAGPVGRDEARFETVT